MPQRSLLRHAAALYQGLGRDPATAPWSIEYGLLAAQGTASCRSAISVSWRIEPAAAQGQRVSSPRKHPAQRQDSLCSPPPPSPPPPPRCLPVCCSHHQRAKRARPLSQSRWLLPWIPYPRGDDQIVLHKLLQDPADPPRQNRFINTTYVKIQHTAQLAEGLALELGEVNLKTLPTLRRTRRTFHRHTGGGPTNSGTSRNGLRPSPEQRTPSQKACHPQSQPARAIEGVAIVGVKPAGAAHICRHASVAPTPSLAFQPLLTEWRRCRRNVDSRRPQGPHAARSSEEDSNGSRPGGYMFKPLPPIAQHPLKSPMK